MRHLRIDLDALKNLMDGWKEKQRMSAKTADGILTEYSAHIKKYEFVKGVLTGNNSVKIYEGGAWNTQPMPSLF